MVSIGYAGAQTAVNPEVPGAYARSERDGGKALMSV